MLHLTPPTATQHDSQISEHIQEFLFLPTVKSFHFQNFLHFLSCLSHENLFTHGLYLKCPHLWEAFSSTLYPIILCGFPQSTGPLSLSVKLLGPPVLLTVTTVSGP